MPNGSASGRGNSKSKLAAVNTFLIDYHEIKTPKKGFSGLFNDYTGESERRESLAERFFHFDYRKENDYYRHLNTLSSRQFRRNELADILIRQNRQFGTGEEQLASIEKLRSARCMLVVTGQQPGLFTGPLYTVYKALTAVTVAERYKEMFPEYDFLPLFWIEGEDHDFAESANTSVFDRGAIRRFVLEPWRKLPEQMVNRTTMGPGIVDIVGEFASTLQESEHTEAIVSLLAEAYHPESTLELAFARTMAYLFRHYPLIFLSPGDPEFKKLGREILHRELETCPSTSHSVIAQSSALESMGYQVQAKPRAVNLFYLNQHDQRLKIEQPSAESFVIVPENRTFSRHQILELCDDHPERFGPNVVLRPVLQDHVLPVFASVAGPGEISYLAQLRKVYEHFGLRMPFIIPRGSFTLVEPPIRRIMDKVLQKAGRPAFSRKQIYHTAFHDLSILRKNAVTGAENHDFDALFEQTEAKIREQLDALAPTLVKLDPTLEQVLAGSSQQISRVIAGIREKTNRAGRRKHNELLAQLEKTSASLFPDNLPQERVVNIFYYLNKYGENLIDTFAAMLRAHATESHIILEL